MKWLKRLFGMPDTVPYIDTHTEFWQWQCLHQDCGTKGKGTQAEVRDESMIHCMNTGHAVSGGVV